jgi:FAD:protein FMN transferase
MTTRKDDIKKDPLLFHDNFMAMNTRLDMVIIGKLPDESQKIFNQAKNEVARLESLLSRFIPQSTISLVNAKAHEKPVLVDHETWEIIMTCKKYHELTKGFFDITSRPILAFWRENLEKDSLPNEIRDICGFSRLILDENKRSVFFPVRNMELDLGGIGKGFAIERINQVLEQNHVEHALVSFGESTVSTRGHHPYGNCWRLGIQHVYKPAEHVYTVDMQTSSMSTSGCNPTNQLESTKKCGHLINPITGYPVSGTGTITVVSGSALEAEILSTAFWVMDRDTIEDIIDNFDLQAIIKISYDESFQSKVEEIRVKKT